MTSSDEEQRLKFKKEFKKKETSDVQKKGSSREQRIKFKKEFKRKDF